MWPNRQRLILAPVLENCRLGSSLSRILLKNNILNSFKLFKRPTPAELCSDCLAPLYSLSFLTASLRVCRELSYLFQATTDTVIFQAKGTISD